MLVNACINHIYRGKYQLVAEELNRIRATKMKRIPHGLRAEISVAPRGGSCVIDLVTSGNVVNKWLLHRGEEIDDKSAITLAYWYLFPPFTPIALIPRLVPRSNWPSSPTKQRSRMSRSGSLRPLPTTSLSAVGQPTAFSEVAAGPV
jgi:hypothetical protein